jgi:hypothetical protein
VRTLCLHLCIFLLISDCSKSSEQTTREVPKQRAELSTLNRGTLYIEECRASGVPVPDTILDSTWVNHGALGTDLAGAALEVFGEMLPIPTYAELWSWTSASPRGICLALPRWRMSIPEVIGNFGVICQGHDSSKVCFWDNAQTPVPQNPARTQAGNVGYVLDSSIFVGGTDLEFNNFNTSAGGGTAGGGTAGGGPAGGGPAGGTAVLAKGAVCTDCHAGANAFVVHPDDPVFQRLLSDSTRSRMMKTASGWYEPLVSGTWPMNSSKERRPWPNQQSTQATCADCHNAGVRNELPEMNNSSLRG